MSLVFFICTANAFHARCRAAAKKDLPSGGLFSFQFSRLSLAVAAQNVDQLVGDHVLDSLTSRLQVLTRIEVIRMLVEVLADRSGDSQTNIGVDIDLADGQLCSVTELFLRNADCIRHLAAELVDLVNKLTRYGRGTVQYDREARQTLGNFLKYVETQRRRNQNALLVAGALIRGELVSAVRGADCDSQRVTAGAGYELLNLYGNAVPTLLLPVWS